MTYYDDELYHYGKKGMKWKKEAVKETIVVKQLQQKSMEKDLVVDLVIWKDTLLEKLVLLLNYTKKSMYKRPNGRNVFRMQLLDSFLRNGLNEVIS